MYSIGYRISKARRYANMNQKELCKKVGINEASLSRYENDMREPKAAVLKLLAKALDVSSDYLLGLTDDMYVDRDGLNDKSVVDVEDIVDIISVMFEGRKVLYKGKLISEEELEEVLFAMRLGVRFALEK